MADFFRNKKKADEKNKSSTGTVGGCGCNIWITAIIIIVVLVIIIVMVVVWKMTRPMSIATRGYYIDDIGTIYR